MEKVGESMAQGKDKGLTASHPWIPATEKMVSDHLQILVIQQKAETRAITGGLHERLVETVTTMMEVGALSLVWEDEMDSYTKLVNCATISPAYKEESTSTKD